MRLSIEVGDIDENKKKLPRSALHSETDCILEDRGAPFLVPNRDGFSMGFSKTIVVVLVAAVFTATLRADDAPDPTTKTVIEKGLKRLETGAGHYPEHRQCFSCHHQAMAILGLTAAKQRGFSVDADLVKSQVDFSLRSFRNTALITKGRGVGGDSTSAGYILTTLAAVDHPADETTAALVEYLLLKQRKDGAWPVAAQRPPTMGSLFTNTALALAALKKYGQPSETADAEELEYRIDSAFTRGRAWLVATKPVTTEDKVFRLRGLIHADAERKAIDEARDQLLGEQREDGSWSQLTDKEGDAYATGTVLMALRAAGLPTSESAYRKGADYLLKTQNEEGSWVVQTRSKPLQVFFDNGDPGGKSQFISFAATGWAVLALLETVPRP
jgi:N-acyl-D-amino-acid deacylase